MMSLTEKRHRFEGIEKLYNDSALHILARSHVCILGIGGVGSWAVEALARSGVGRLTLVDLDEACLSNINRQIHALTHTVGQSKISLMKERIYGINPHCQVKLIEDFVSAENIADILGQGFDFIFDAIDGISNKCQVISYCYHHKLPLISAGAAGGIENPYALRIEDLNTCSYDRLLFYIRKKLRQKFNFPRNSSEKWGIPVVYTPNYVNEFKKAETCAPSDKGSKLDCAGSLGSACFVTGSMGFFAASYIVNQLIKNGLENSESSSSHLC